MTDEVNPMTMLPPDVSVDVARSMAAEAVRLGSSVQDVNAELQRRGAPLLNANSVDAAKLAKERLFNDSDFKTRYAAGDSRAIAEFNASAIRSLNAKGNLLDAPASPADYNLTSTLHAAGEVYGNPGAVVDSFRAWSHGLGLSQSAATAISTEHVEFVGKTENMSAEDAAAFGEKEAAMLARALGPTADAQISAASATLSSKLGRKVDLSEAVRTNGATVVLRLIHHAEDLRRQGQ